MKITTREAKEIENRIVDACKSLESTVMNGAMKNPSSNRANYDYSSKSQLREEGLRCVNIFEDVISVRNQQREEVLNSFSLLLDLQALRFRLRSTVARARVETGINELVADLLRIRAARKSAQWLAGARPGASDTAVLNEVAARRNQIERMNVAMEDSHKLMALDLLTADDTQHADAQVTKLHHEEEGVKARLGYLNANAKVEVSDADEALLRSIGLIS